MENMKSEYADLVLEYLIYFINHNKLSSEQKIDVVKDIIEFAEKIEGIPDKIDFFKNNLGKYSKPFKLKIK